MNKMVMIGAAAGLVAAAGGGWFVMGRDTGPSAEEQKAAAAKAAELRRQAEEVHEVAVFSYVYPASDGGTGSSLPVMVKLKIVGRDGLGEVCQLMPRVKEAMLRVFAPRPVRLRPRSPGYGLDAFGAPLREAINRMLPGQPVRAVRATALLDPAVGGAAARRTDNLCREFRDS